MIFEGWETLRACQAEYDSVLAMIVRLKKLEREAKHDGVLSRDIREKIRKHQKELDAWQDAA